jgi:hypothetical protein
MVFDSPLYNKTLQERKLPGKRGRLQGGFQNRMKSLQGVFKSLKSNAQPPRLVGPTRRILPKNSLLNLTLSRTLRPALGKSFRINK